MITKRHVLECSTTHNKTGHYPNVHQQENGQYSAYYTAMKAIYNCTHTHTHTKCL